MPPAIRTLLQSSSLAFGFGAAAFLLLSSAFDRGAARDFALRTSRRAICSLKASVLRIFVHQHRKSGNLLPSRQVARRSSVQPSRSASGPRLFGFAFGFTLRSPQKKKAQKE